MARARAWASESAFKSVRKNRRPTDRARETDKERDSEGDKERDKERNTERWRQTKRDIEREREGRERRRKSKREGEGEREGEREGGRERESLREQDRVHARQKRCTHIFHMNHGEVEQTGEWSEDVTTIRRRIQMFGLFCIRAIPETGLVVHKRPDYFPTLQIFAIPHHDNFYRIRVAERHIYTQTHNHYETGQIARRTCTHTGTHAHAYTERTHLSVRAVRAHTHLTTGKRIQVLKDEDGKDILKLRFAL